MDCGLRIVKDGKDLNWKWVNMIQTQVSKSKQIVAVLLGVLVLLPSFVFAAADYGSESLFSAGAGSRAIAMGGAFTALSDDSSGAYYNPAGMINIKKQQVSLTHYPLYLGALYNSVSYAQPILDFGVVGAAVYRLYSGDIITYSADDIAGETTAFEEYKGTASYAKRLTENITAGVNVNIFSLNILNVSGIGFGADAALLYEPFDFLSVGFTCHNIMKPSLSLSDSKEELPQTYTLGALYKLDIKPVSVKLTVDASKDELISAVKIRAGFELKTFEILSLRAGYNDGQINLGAGAEIFGTQLDYSYSMDNYLGGLSRFSLSYNFGMTLEQQKVSREKELKEQVKQLVEKEFRQKEMAKAGPYYAKAFEFYRAGKMEDALEEVENALAWSKDYADAQKLKALIGKKLVGGYYEIAMSAYKKSDLITALENFKTVYSIDRGYRDAKAYIDRINQNLEMKSEARELFVKGVELYAEKKYDEASDIFNRALAVEPGNKVIKTYVSKTSARMRKSAKGRNLTDEQAMQVKKLYFAGLKMYTAGDLKSALRAWKDAAVINPDDIKLQKSIEKAQAEQAELQKRGIR